MRSGKRSRGSPSWCQNVTAPTLWVLSRNAGADGPYMETRLFNVLSLALTAVAVAPAAKTLWREYKQWQLDRQPVSRLPVEHPEFRAAWRSVCDDLRVL